jgi:hypothetical protein
MIDGFFTEMGDYLPNLLCAVVKRKCVQLHISF